MDTANKIRVTIFEDNDHLRSSLSFLIDISKEFRCIAAYPNSRNALADLEKNTPDIIMMDIEMPGMNGIDTTYLIRQHFPQVRILIFTVFDDDEKIFRSLCAGGSGYLLKSSTPEQVIQALWDTYNGGAPLSPAVAERMVRFFQHNVPAYQQVNDHSLTPKEKELLQLMVDGKSYKMIADALKISIETVKFHIKNIYRKLHVNSSSEAIVKAIRQNIV